MTYTPLRTIETYPLGRLREFEKPGALAIVIFDESAESWEYNADKHYWRTPSGRAYSDCLEELAKLFPPARFLLPAELDLS